MCLEDIFYMVFKHSQNWMNPICRIETKQKWYVMSIRRPLLLNIFHAAKEEQLYVSTHNESLVLNSPFGLYL